MKTVTILVSLFFITLLKACGQTTPRPTEEKNLQQVGDGCEGCEAVYESPVSFENLPWVDTLPGFTGNGPKMMVSGTVYMADKKTAAKNVVLYIYHTDQGGRYPNTGQESGWGKRHGYIRTWLKTNEKGQYKFYTLRPASYPNSTAVQHIHPTIKEPGKTAYWIDEFVFDDDPFLTAQSRKQLQQRGGSGIVRLKQENGVWVGQRDIYLGMNIPGYASTK